MIIESTAITTVNCSAILSDALVKQLSNPVRWNFRFCSYLLQIKVWKKKNLSKVRLSSPLLKLWVRQVVLFEAYPQVQILIFSIPLFPRNKSCQIFANLSAFRYTFFHTMVIFWYTLSIAWFTQTFDLFLSSL